MPTTRPFAPFPSPRQTRIVERHGPCRPFAGQPLRCAFCGFYWSGHPASIQNNPDPAPGGPGGSPWN